MTDAIGKPPAPGAEGGLPPAASFHDDKVAGEHEADKAAWRRAVEAKTGKTPPRIAKEPEQVSAASSFRPAQEETPEAAQIRRQRSLVAGRPGTPQGAQRAQATQRGEAERLAKRVQVIFSALSELSALAERQVPNHDQASDQGQDVNSRQPAGTACQAQSPAVSTSHGVSGRRVGSRASKAAANAHRRIEAISDEEQAGQRRQGQAAPDEQAAVAHPPAPLVVSAATRLMAAQQQARYQLQTLVAGGTGFALLADPMATFAGLFAQLPVWPEHVPPGHQPLCAEDFDAFFAWVFLPLAAGHSLEES